MAYPYHYTRKPRLSGDAFDERAALTDDEIKTVKAIRDAFKTTDSAYCCSGHVPTQVKRPSIFYPLTPATFATEWTKDETMIPTR